VCKIYHADSWLFLSPKILESKYYLGTPKNKKTKETLKKENNKTNFFLKNLDIENYNLIELKNLNL